MIKKYYKSMLAQVYKRVGYSAHNMVLAKYSNDLSIEDLKLEEEGREYTHIRFVGYEFRKEEIAGAFEPFMGMMRDIFRNYHADSLDEIMEKCNVYKPLRPIFSSYFKTGRCERVEPLLYNETDYEKIRMMDAVLQMLIALSKDCPFVIVINRVQLASYTTIRLLKRLLSAEDTKNIGVLLGTNELQRVPEYIESAWTELIEELGERSCAINIGNAVPKEENEESTEHNNYQEDLRILRNSLMFMDFRQTVHGLERIDRRIRFENQKVSAKSRFEIWYLYASVSIYIRDLPKALEISEDIRRLNAEELLAEGENRDPEYFYYFITSTAYMYQNKLEEAIRGAKKAAELAGGDERLAFEAELLETQAKMSGWDNVFFCTRDIENSQELIERLLKYNYLNHLAYIYIFAYDNDPEIVAQADTSENKLTHFSKGIKLARENGNERLLYNAYQKNIMLAVANGLYHIGILYTVRTFEELSDKKSMEAGRAYSAIGYDLSSMGKNELATEYFVAANNLFYELNLPEDIAEVYYNMAQNYIDMDCFEEAAAYLHRCLHIADKLNMNSLRVCNLSKLFILLALCNQMQGNRIQCDQYMERCKRFLDFIVVRDKELETSDINHDYVKYEDDKFLYLFTLALTQIEDGENDKAMENLEQAEVHFRRTEGTMYFCYRLFCTVKEELYEKIGITEKYEAEQKLLEKHQQKRRKQADKIKMKILKPLEAYRMECMKNNVTDQQIELLIHQESIRRSYLREHRQMQFVSTWQKLMDVSNVSSAENSLDNVMQTFMYQFNLDCAMYVQYRNRLPRVLYDNTDVEVSDEVLDSFRKIFEKRRKGFVVSKVSANYAEHHNVMKWFDEDRICSMVAVPFFDDGRVTSIMITYIRMKDNWHSSVNRYMLDEEDLSVYEMLFRDVQYAMNRLEAYERIYEMNQLLYKSAVTDQLTGVMNRKGFYEKIAALVEETRQGKREKKFGIMFIDLDNFKGYNDTFGHDIGDLLLVSMSHIFEKISLTDGFVVRWGGDEFIILMYTDDRESLEEYAKQIYSEIRAHDSFKGAIENATGMTIEIEEGKELSCSIGIVSSDSVENEDDIESMIMQADDLMYDVKKHSKGTYKFI